MPVGLINAPTAFMCLMNQVFSTYLDKFVLVLINGILVYSKGQSEHEEHLRLVYMLFENINFIYVRLSKCDFQLEIV